MEFSAKLSRLENIFREMNSVLVTFSGGADSTFLSKVAAAVLGGRAVAMTAVSASLPVSELEESKWLARMIGIRHLVVESKELDDPRYAANPANRCYFCKSELFSIAASEAKELGLSFIVDGTHLDDLKDVRPGRQAAKEWAVRSPLLEAGFTKEDVRQASRFLGLPTWNKPAAACLASRIPAGTPVTFKRLSQVERCEEALKNLGFSDVRARHLEESVRLELTVEGISRISDPTVEAAVMEACTQAGFKKVSIASRRRG